MRKQPNCKNCGGKHYTYQCWHKKLAPTRRTRTVRRVSTGSLERQKVIKELDRITSLYVRQNGMDRLGYNTCYTCGARYHWKTLDCGHYIKRRYLHTRWALDNLRPQCRHCNRTLGGNYRVYEAKITRELGTDKTQQLWDQAYNTDKVMTVELELLLKTVTAKYHELLKKY